MEKHRIVRSKTAGRLAAVLLATSCLTPILLTGGAAPAWAATAAATSLQVARTP
jgi:hypothetical protein